MTCRVGVLTGPNLKPWMVRAVETMVERTDARVTVVVVEDSPVSLVLAAGSLRSNSFFPTMSFSLDVLYTSTVYVPDL